jgi:hypothetical protein
MNKTFLVTSPEVTINSKLNPTLPIALNHVPVIMPVMMSNTTFKNAPNAIPLNVFTPMATTDVIAVMLDMTCGVVLGIMPNITLNITSYTIQNNKPNITFTKTKETPIT